MTIGKSVEYILKGQYYSLAVVSNLFELARERCPKGVVLATRKGCGTRWNPSPVELALLSPLTDKEITKLSRIRMPKANGYAPYQRKLLLPINSLHAQIERIFR